MKGSNVVRVGPSLIGLTFLVLLTLKLTGQAAALTWFWVFFPLMLPFILISLVLLIVGLMALGVASVESFKKR